MSKTNYLPFGFQYPKGLHHSDANPDPKIEDIRQRVAWLNDVHELSNLPGHIFCAGMHLFQQKSEKDADEFWTECRNRCTPAEMAEIAVAMAPLVANEPERLEFPNAIALFDCRFVSTKEWEHIRRYSIGGSEAATVLGLSKYQTPRSLWHEKRTRYDEPFDIGREQIFDYGHAVEPYIIEELASRLGARVYPEYRMFAHKRHPYISCNPDGILLFPDGHFALFEAKTAFWLKKPDWKEIPDYYAPQPRQYLEVLDDPRLSEGYIGVCFGAEYGDIFCHKYIRDCVAGAAQVEAVAGFWHDYIATGIIPPFSGNAELDLTAQYMYIPHEGVAKKETPLPDASLRLFHEYFTLERHKKDLNQDLFVLKNKEDQLKDQILGMVNEGMTIVSCPGEVSYTVTVKDRNRKTANLHTLKERDPAAAEHLERLAKALKDPALSHTTPKVKIVVPKPPKAPRTKKGAK